MSKKSFIVYDGEYDDENDDEEYQHDEEYDDDDDDVYDDYDDDNDDDDDDDDDDNDNDEDEFLKNIYQTKSNQLNDEDYRYEEDADYRYHKQKNKKKQVVPPRSFRKTKPVSFMENSASSPKPRSFTKKKPLSFMENCASSPKPTSFTKRKHISSIQNSVSSFPAQQGRINNFSELLDWSASRNIVNPDDASSVDEGDNDEELQQVIVCKKCDPPQNYYDIYKFLDHRKKKHAYNKCYDCARCEKTYDTAFELECHKDTKAHKNKQLECLICGYTRKKDIKVQAHIYVCRRNFYNTSRKKKQVPADSNL